MSITYRYNPRKKETNVKFRPKSRHYSNVEERVTDYIINHASTTVHKEKIAEALNVKTHIVEHCLHKLNLKGIVSQPIHEPIHDSKRDRWDPYKGSSDWGADRYRVNNKEKEIETKMSELFRGGLIRTKANNELIYSYVEKIYYDEKDLLLSTATEANIENWNKLNKATRTKIMETIICKSKLISCYFIKFCSYANKKEFSKALTTVMENPCTAFWVMDNCDISERIEHQLFKTILSFDDYCRLFFKHFSKDYQKTIAIKKILVTDEGLRFILSFCDKLGDVERSILVDKVKEKNNMELTKKLFKNFELNDEDKNKLSNMLVVLKMRGEI